MLKAFLLLIIVMAVSIDLNAQDINIDSLKSELNKNLPDTTRINQYVKLTDAYLHALKVKEALIYAQKAETLSRQLKNEKYQIISCSLLGDVYFKMEQMENAYRYENRAYDLAVRTNNIIAQADYFYKMALIYQSAGDYKKIIESLLEELKLEERINEDNRMLSIYARLANAYAGSGDFKAAIECEFKVLDVSRKANREIITCVALDKIGSYYTKDGQFEKAEEYFFLAMELAKKMKKDNILGYSHIHYGDFCYDTKRYKDALEYYKSGLRLAFNDKFKSSGISVNNKIGKVLFVLKKYDEAGKLLIQVQKEALAMRLTNELLLCYESLSKVDSAKGDFKQAYYWKDKIIDLKEELNKESTIKEIGRIEVQYELGKEEKTRRLEEEKKELESKAELSKQKQIIYMAVIIIPLLMLIIYLLHRSRRQVRINNETLQRKVNERTNELLISKEKAESSEQLKSVFLSHMSHEIRTPLSAVMNLSGILNEEFKNLSDEMIKDLIASINRSGNRIIRTIEMILNYSEIVSDSYTPLFKEISLDKICRDVLNETKYLGKHSVLSIAYSCPASNPVINGDEYSIHKVIKNIVENAIIYTEKGNVELSLTEETGTIIFSCRDTGIGMSDEYKEKLFQPFTQEQLGYTRKYEGLGLGLALSRFYCDLNKAEISCESRKGEGSTFKIVFPKLT